MILVTGGTGLVGARLLFDLAASGKKARALRRPSSRDLVFNTVFAGNDSLKNRIEWITGDVTNVYDVMEAMQDVDEVFHCAAKVSFYRTEYKEMMMANVEGTANMVNMAIEQGVKKFCHVSSIAALGRVEENKTMDESVTWKSSKNNSNYAISKYNSEREVWRAMEEGLHAVIVNPSIIIGPGDWTTGSSSMFRQIWRGMKFYSEGVNGFVDVRDVTKSMIGLMEKNISGQRFILSAENCSYHQIFDYIADGLGKPRPSIAVSRLISELGWRAEAFRGFILRRKPFITSETARNSRKKWYYSSEKIKNAIGIDFIPIQKSIEDSAEIFLRSYAGRDTAA